MADEQRLQEAPTRLSSGPAVQGAVPPLHSQISNIVSGRIKGGALAPGAVLLEARIAAEFGSSRAPARRALSELEAEGLLTKAEGRGYRVLGGFDECCGSSPSQAEPVGLLQVPSWERIYAEVETNIVSRTALAGWRVIEAEIAKYHGVSRTVAREVVARLQQRGVVKRDGTRWYAPGLTPKYVAELYEMRWTLEPLALRKAFDRMPPVRIREARHRIEAAIAKAHELDGIDLDPLETDLHVGLLSYCDNRSLLEAIGLYQSLLVAHSFLYRWGPRLFPTEPFLPEHLEILTALDAGQVSEAAGSLDRHLRRSLNRALSRLDAMNDTPMPEPLPYLLPCDSGHR